MNKKEMQKRIKELYKLEGEIFKEGCDVGEELCYLEMQLERINNNEVEIAI